MEEWITVKAQELLNSLEKYSSNRLPKTYFIPCGGYSKVYSKLEQAWEEKFQVSLYKDDDF